MRSLCANCVNFDNCKLASDYAIYIINCRDHKKGQKNDVKYAKLLSENQTVVKKSVVKVDNKKVVSKRIKTILKTFPQYFKAKELTNEYNDIYGEKLSLTKDLRKKFTKKATQGHLFNKVRKS